MISATESKLDIVQLTTRQRLFVDHYVSSFNASEAARQAGYKGKYINRLASQLLGHKAIKEEIQRRVGPKLAEDPTISPTTIKRGVFSAIDECKTPKDKFVGYELLGRMTPGTFEPAPTATVNVFAAIGDIASKLASLNKGSAVASSTVETASLPSSVAVITSSQPIHPPASPIIPSPGVILDAVSPALDDTSTISNSPDEPTSPPAGVLCENADSPKIAEQK